MAPVICPSLAGCFPLRLAPQGWGPVSLSSQPLPARTPPLSPHNSVLEGEHERFSTLLPAVCQDSCYQSPKSHQATAAISTSWPVPEDPAHKAVFGFAEVSLGFLPAWEYWYHKHTRLGEGRLGERRFRELVPGASQAQSQPPMPPTHSQTLLKSVGLESVGVIN